MCRSTPSPDTAAQARRRSLCALLVAAMLVLGAAPTSTPVPAGDRIAPGDVLTALNQTLDWYRQARIVMRSVSSAGGGILFSRDDEQIALRLLARAFDTARAQATLIAADASRTPDPTGTRPVNARARLEAEMRRHEADVAQLQQQLRTTPARARPPLEGKLTAARRRLELDRARLEVMAKLQAGGASLAGDDPEGDLTRQIETLHDAVPELSASNGRTPEPSIASVETSSGAWSAVRRLLALQRSRQSLDDLEGATSALTRNVDDALKTARSALPSTVARLRELTRDPDDPAPAAGAATAGPAPPAADVEREFQALLQRGKLLAGVLIPLHDESALAHRFADDLRGWRRTLDRQSLQLLQEIAIDLLGVLVAIAVILIAAALWRVAVTRYVGDGYRRRLLMTARNVLVMTAIVLVVIFHFTTELTALVTALGFAAAGIAFALQNVILALAGYFSMVAPNGIRVGDRVSLQGPFGYVHGEVLDIGFVRIRLRELGGDPPQPTGRLVVFSNSVVFTGSFFKETPSQPASRAA
jgi:hypothetical protein